MVLESVAEYDESAVGDVGAHAVVGGGSMAGLLSARVLADGYDRVTLLERDPLPDEAVARPGIPQANHVHVMLEPARVILEALFDGYQSELQPAGGVIIDACRELDYYENGAVLAAAEPEMLMPCASRALFEQITRRRVAATAGVTIRDECHVTEYETAADAATVEGVSFIDPNGDETLLDADLVVDATGRRSKTPRWLDEHGYPTPRTQRVEIDLAYGTVILDRPAADTSAYLCAPSAPTTRGGTAVPIEADRWLVTLFGLHGDHPPSDRPGYLGFADALPSDQLATLLREREWRSDEIARYPFPASEWRRYDDLERFPDGLVVTGDAIASFNPIYGQGMSAAALDALQLHHTIANGPENIGVRFFDRVADHLDVVWQIAVGADFEFEETTGTKPTGVGLFNRYVDRVVATAHTDATVAEAFYRVLRLEREPTSLFHPHIAARVLWPS
ncbi:FAD-dependent oxidoreductase [Halobaculum magnesiiphilum]|uniref:Oxidoreductase n=1 Tax=Halobaculum magnesiiphilum TaxID=1017351 RepID=A0A8T8WEK9_9EURY|nr:FAD-dependent monooxygenase [Halobaculum magnesiiphilum]QZP38299.1 oxidoreductase [Halobaculum magnesiiphilum]